MNVQALGWTLLHFLWQGTAVAALLASLHLLLRRAAPQLRYLSASVALFVMALLPVATFRLMQDPPASTGTALVSFGQEAMASEAAAGQRSWGAAAVGERPRLQSWVEPALPALVIAWGVGVLFLSLRSLGGWWVAQRLKRVGLGAVPAGVQDMLERLKERLKVSAPVRMFESARVDVPTVVGWLRPALLLPASAITGLSTQQLELILAHELAHIRRHDYLVNLLQTAVETVLFYHPAVWWVSHRMRVEREHCCDDLAVGACGNVVVYARALADLEEWRSERPVLAVAINGGSLLDRVKRLAGPPPHLSRSSRGLAALLAVAALAVAGGAGPLLLAQDERPAVAAPPEPEMEAVEAEVLLPLLDETGRALAEPQEPEEPEAPEPPEDPEDPEMPEPPEAPEAPEVPEAPEAPETPEPPEAPEAPDPPSAPTVCAHQRVMKVERATKVERVVRERMRAYGVTNAYIRGLEAQGLKGISSAEAIRLRAQGVTPAFVKQLKEAGRSDLTVGRLMALRAAGIDGRYVSRLDALGYDDLSTVRLMALRAQGITPEYVESLAQLGYRGLSTGMLLALRAQGVTPEYVRELRQSGLEDLSAGALIELRAQGITGAFVRQAKRAGHENPTVQQLIELHRRGLLTAGRWWRKRV